MNSDNLLKITYHVFDSLLGSYEWNIGHCKIFVFCIHAALVTAVPFGYTLLKSPAKPDISVTIETLVCITVIYVVYLNICQNL